MTMNAVVYFDRSEWDRIFKRFKVSLSDATKLLHTAYSTVGFADIMQHFREEKGPDGKWEPRSSVTQSVYAAIASGRTKPPEGYRRGSFSPSNRLLQLTGNMRQSILPSNWKRVDSHAIAVFANAPYSGKHDLGDPRENLPERPFMWLSRTAQDRMAGMMTKILEDQAK